MVKGVATGRRCDYCGGDRLYGNRSVHDGCRSLIGRSRAIARDMAVRCVLHPGSSWRLDESVTVEGFASVILKQTAEERFALWLWLNVPGWKYPPPFFERWLIERRPAAAAGIESRELVGG